MLKCINDKTFSDQWLGHRVPWMGHKLWGLRQGNTNNFFTSVHEITLANSLVLEVQQLDGMNVELLWKKEEHYAV